MNIHRNIRYLPLDTNVTFTEKIDGSNLGIQVALVDGTWTFKNLVGRSSIIAADTLDKKVTTIKYGNAGQLGNLPFEMLKFASALGNFLKLTEIIVFGEAFRGKNQKLVSWHPFGYRLPSDERACYNLTKDLHNIFLQVSDSKLAHTILKNKGEPMQRAEYFATIAAATYHVVAPPLLLFSGTLYDGITNLYPLLMSQDPTFEGCFIVSNEKKVDNVPVTTAPVPTAPATTDTTTTTTDDMVIEHEIYYENKLKTGHFEEQAYFIFPDDFDTFEPRLKSVYEMLKAIFKNKIELPDTDGTKKPKQPVGRKTDDVALLEKIKIAYERELTKRVDMPPEAIAAMHHKARIEYANEITSAICDEIISHYTDANTEAPWTKDVILDVARRRIYPIIMKA